MSKKTVVFDFDGVIHSYTSGWKGTTCIPDPPVDGIAQAIDQIRAAGYEVVVVSTRCANPLGVSAIATYLRDNGITVDKITAEKPPAIVYIDDRAICFNGEADTLLNQIRGFKPWHQKKGLQVRINTHGNPMPESHGEWIDLRTAEDVTLKPLEFKIISLGVSMELPDGYYGQLVPRSSTCKAHGIIQANSVGIFENSFCGDGDVWGFPAVAIRETFIPKGTRICQFCVKKKEEYIEFIQVESLGNPDRGGCGSTGQK